MCTTVTSLQQAAILARVFSLTHTHIQMFFPGAIPLTMILTRGLVTCRSGTKVEKQCLFYCKPDHLFADCAALTPRQQGPASKQPKRVGLIKTESPWGQSTAPKALDDCCEPFTDLCLSQEKPRISIRSQWCKTL